MTIDHALRFVVFAFCIPAAAFFTSFALTFSSGKFRADIAAIFYSIGILSSMGLPVYFFLFRDPNMTFGTFPMTEWLELCFGIAAIMLLWPSIPQQIAMRLGMLLFFVICPVLIIIQVLFQFLQFHHLFRFDLTIWVLYAVLWFRVRDGYAPQRAS